MPRETCCSLKKAAHAILRNLKRSVSGIPYPVYNKHCTTRPSKGQIAAWRDSVPNSVGRFFQAAHQRLKLWSAGAMLQRSKGRCRTGRLQGTRLRRRPPAWASSTRPRRWTASQSRGARPCAPTVAPARATNRRWNGGKLATRFQTVLVSWGCKRADLTYPRRLTAAPPSLSVGGEGRGLGGWVRSKSPHAVVLAPGHQQILKPSPLRVHAGFVGGGVVVIG